MELSQRAPQPASDDAAIPRPPRVVRVEVENFRLLQDVNVPFERDVTVCVGRNNTGKTSLAEVLSKFLKTTDFSMRIEDFSSKACMQFYEAYCKYARGEEGAARKALPEIKVTIHIDYDGETEEYGPLGPLIVDLDPNCSRAIAILKYSLKPGSMRDLFHGAAKGTVDSAALDPESMILELLGPRIPHLFERSAVAVDPTDPSNMRRISMTEITRAIKLDFVKAQRGLDDEKDRPNDRIGKILESIFLVAAKSDDGSILKSFARETEKALEDIVSNLNDHVANMYTKMAPTVSQFGYPGMGNREFSTRTTLDTKRLLSDFTSIRYPSFAGVELPESYSGLGYRNLLLILLTLFSYFRDYSADSDGLRIHLVFIEEPEAHLHPQMQETFIQQLGIFKEKFPSVSGEPIKPWNAQFVVTTHSAHIANRAGFSAIRYFRREETPESADEANSIVLNLAEAPGIDKEFLHKYLTLTRADLFFADKAILIEGTTERIFLPAAIAKFDMQARARSDTGLASQYVSIMEVGGAFAHIFYPFVDFLGLQTLVITDLDAVGEIDGKQKACSVHDPRASGTSNHGIRTWFEDQDFSPTELVKRAEQDIPTLKNRAIAYEVPEHQEDPCGRTFEDAFILANPELFDASKRDGKNLLDLEDEAREIARRFKKSDFALTYAITRDDWRIPRYIERGLEWLLDRVEPAEATEKPKGEQIPDVQVAVK